MAQNSHGKNYFFVIMKRLDFYLSHLLSYLRLFRISATISTYIPNLYVILSNFKVINSNLSYQSSIYSTQNSKKYTQLTYMSTSAEHLCGSTKFYTCYHNYSLLLTKQPENRCKISLYFLFDYITFNVLSPSLICNANEVFKSL